MRRPSFRETNRASLHLRSRHLRADLELEVTPAGLGAIGLLVSGILLSVVPIVWVSTRKLPDRK
ncbi:hypothetical protein [Falsirhodobacter sp. 1013]|uniref:hypothetical protein n=1 Tax=Falsirhodobacter sp. 1013 TaxID=3417566 RepID=UPI003EBFDF74